MNNLKDLILSGVPYQIAQNNNIDDLWYIVPRNLDKPGYIEYIILCSPKNMSLLRDRIEDYENLRDSPLWKKLEGKE